LAFSSLPERINLKPQFLSLTELAEDAEKYSETAKNFLYLKNIKRLLRLKISSVFIGVHPWLMAFRFRLVRVKGSQ
jgi:hypothetical protein